MLFFANQPLLSLFSWFLLSHHKAICHDLWQKNSTGNLQINHWHVNKGCKNVSSFDIWNQSSHNEFNCCLHNFVNKASTMCKIIWQNTNRCLNKGILWSMIHNNRVKGTLALIPMIPLNLILDNKWILFGKVTQHNSLIWANSFFQIIQISWLSLSNEWTVILSSFCIKRSINLVADNFIDISSVWSTVVHCWNSNSISSLDSSSTILSITKKIIE